MSESKEIANWKEDMKKAAVKTAKEERPENSFISLKGGIMTYQDQELDGLECVIINAIYARTCFMRPYDADDNDPPECFSLAFDKKDMRPHENVPKPFADICNETACEWAKFNTALQGQGPRCKTRRKLIVMPVSGLENVAEAEFASLVTPPTSAANYSAYANKVASTEGIPPWAARTFIKVVPHRKKQFEVLFEFKGPIKDEKALAAIHARIPQADQMLLQPYTYDQESGSAVEDKDTNY